MRQIVQQMIDLKSSEYGLRNVETNSSTHQKQFPVAVKKAALRDVQNENRVPMTIGNFPSSKDKGQFMDASKVSGTKRPSPEAPVRSSSLQSKSTNAANAHLVYVRRKSESEFAKTSASDSRSINTDSMDIRQLTLPEETAQPKPQMNEPQVSSFPAFAPIPMISSISASGKPTLPLPHGQSNTGIAPAESNYHLVASADLLLNDLKRIRNFHWEERHRQLQILLKKLDESDQEDYVQMLRSLSAVELSRHAVELEKRSIQLSLEEAKEVQRVGYLNVLGKSMKNFKALSVHQGQSEN